MKKVQARNMNSKGQGQNQSWLNFKHCQNLPGPISLQHSCKIWRK